MANFGAGVPKWLISAQVLCALLARFPGDPFDYAVDDGNVEALKAYREACLAAAAKGEEAPPPPPGRKAVVATPQPPAEPLVINQGRLDEKAREAERLFGIPAARYRDAVEAATAEANAGVECDAPESLGPAPAFLTTLPLLLVMGLLAGYARNGAASSSFPTYLARTFPREARVFGIEL